VRALRHYEQIGLLAARRTEAGYRMFAPAALEHVMRIQVLLKNGFTLAQIQPVASMFGLESKSRRQVCADVIRLYHQKLEELDGRIASLVALRESAAGRLEYLEQQRREGGPT
jgi:DNA-binding transcriptional MerR regulator